MYKLIELGYCIYQGSFEECQDYLANGINEECLDSADCTIIDTRKWPTGAYTNE